MSLTLWLFLSSHQQINTCTLYILDLEWKIIYVGSAESEEYDQTLDTIVVGPIVAGKHMFVFEVRIA